MIDSKGRGNGCGPSKHISKPKSCKKTRYINTGNTGFFGPVSSNITTNVDKFRFDGLIGSIQRVGAKSLLHFSAFFLLKELP
jgi:hypothetical protein